MVMVTVTTPVGFDAKATVMKMGSLQTGTGSHENDSMNVTCVSFHNFVDTGGDPRVTDRGWSCITNRGRGIGKWAGALGQRWGRMGEGFIAGHVGRGMGMRAGAGAGHMCRGKGWMGGAGKEQGQGAGAGH